MRLDDECNSEICNVHFYRWVDEFSGELYLERTTALSFNRWSIQDLYPPYDPPCIRHFPQLNLRSEIKRLEQELQQITFLEGGESYDKGACDVTIIA